MHLAIIWVIWCHSVLAWCQIRKINRMQRTQRHKINVLRYLNANGRADVFGLTARLGLSESSLSRVMRDMLADNLVEVFETNSDGIGRPAQIFRLNPALTYAIGVELTTTVIRWVLINAVGTIVHRDEYAIVLPDTNESFLQIIEGAVAAALESVPVPQAHISSIGVSIHGFLNHDEGSVIYCTSIPGPRNIPVGAHLRGHFGRLTELLENGRAIGLVESQLGSMQAVSNFITVTVGTNTIGTGIFIDNQLYMGETKMAGHLAHISVDSSGPPCVCGGRGCVEVMATNSAVLETVSGRLQGQSLTALAFDDLPLTLERIVKAAEQGERLSFQTLNQVGELIGIGIGTLSKVLNINYVLMAGLLPRESSVYMDAVRRSVRLNTLPLVEPVIDVSRMPAHAVAQGAALYALRTYIDREAQRLIQAGVAQARQEPDPTQS